MPPLPRAVAARVHSVNVGRPRAVSWGGRAVRTAIFKEPVTGRVPVRGVNLEGDAQADLRVHGGPRKAVYAYPSEHYGFWRDALARNLPWGSFGENLTTEGLLEADVRVGERLLIGSAVLEVTQPRYPCYKLGVRFGDPGMVDRFLRSERLGFYLSVAREGDVGVGDAIERVPGPSPGPTILEVLRAKLALEEIG